MKNYIAKLLAKSLQIKESEIQELIETPPTKDLGDYAFPCFTLVKTFKKNPNQIAEDLAKKISPQKDLEKIEAKGPYINFFINRNQLAQSTIKEILKQKNNYGKQKIPSLVLIESPGPNTNKPLHIGHARNIVLGQSIKKILEFSGNKVKAVNINNDRGVHICKSMIAYQKYGNNQTPEKAKRKSDHFVGDFYVKFAKELEKNPKLDEEAQECLQKWENNDKKTIELWKKMNSWAFKGFEETYKKFNLKIDKHYYESKIYKQGKEIILEQLKKGIVKKKPDGALYIDLSKEGLGEKILVRTDGTSIYITFDLYLAVLRQKDFKFNKMLYLVANEQNYHFKVLFTLLEKFGFKWAKNLEHVNYGLVHLESGRMKSREGTVVDSDDLIEELQDLAKEEIKSRYKDLKEKEVQNRAEKIALAALRYYFLKIERQKDMLFKPEESISFEGNTGPYLLYTYARARSILKKANYKPSKIKMPKEITEEEKSLILQLSKFPEVVKKAYEELAPNHIANYAFEISKAFSEYYHKTKVLGSPEEKFRLALVDSFSQVLKNALKLLQIEVLENM